MHGRIGEGEVEGDTNSDLDSRRQKAKNENGKNLRPKGSDHAAPADEENQKETGDEESEIVIPETERVPNTPSIADYIKHQITQYPY